MIIDNLNEFCRNPHCFEDTCKGECTYPESSEEITKEFDITQQTDKINFRARGRQAKIRVSCSSQGASWQWGSVRLGFQGDGQR